MIVKVKYGLFCLRVSLIFECVPVCLSLFFTSKKGVNGGHRDGNCGDTVRQSLWFTKTTSCSFLFRLPLYKNSDIELYHTLTTYLFIYTVTLSNFVDIWWMCKLNALTFVKSSYLLLKVSYSLYLSPFIYLSVSYISPFTFKLI